MMVNRIILKAFIKNDICDQHFLKEPLLMHIDLIQLMGKA